MPRGTVLTVRAYTWDGCVTLRLNGKPVLQHARLPVAYEDEAHEADGSCVPVNSTTDFTATWQVPYQPGELSATLQSSPMEAVREAVVDAAAMPTVALRTHSGPAHRPTAASGQVSHPGESRRPELHYRRGYR